LMIASQAEMPADSQMAPTQELTPLGMPHVCTFQTQGTLNITISLLATGANV
jgi:hypothetical protein